ncbi:MAG: hypothetical protein V3S25_11535 [Nitrospirales bacterium]
MLEIFFYTSLAVMAVAAVRGLYLLGVLKEDRDLHAWCNRQLEERIVNITESNRILKEQNTRLIDYHTRVEQLDDDTFYSGNIFDTE